MSGHSKWSQIKRKKAVVDAKKGKIFSKLVRFIAVAAREKGADPATNPGLRVAIEKAKAVNMPLENIERAIAKASGADGTVMEEVIYEAYGPAGCAILIETITDNKNRTVSEIKHILSMHNGKFANAGSVAWLFEKQGILSINASNKNKDEVELEAIEAGAIDIDWQDNILEIFTNPDQLEKVKNQLTKKGMTVEESLLEFIPKTTIAVDDNAKNQIEKLYEALDENDDVQNIYLNIQ